MKTWLILPAAALLVAGGCGKNTLVQTTANLPPPPASAAVPPANQLFDPCAMVLVPHHGDGRLDRQIIHTQEKVKVGPNSFESLELLGWLYVAKARESFDPGYYKLAEQCAHCLDSRRPDCAEALLLRGHVLQNLHQFKEAEPLARELVEKRGRSFDFGLLGDVLMEQGRLEEAAVAYQTMVNIKPDLEAYARIAHFRWLKGDLAAAEELMGLAVSAASPNAPETAAWVNTRLAFYQFQSGDVEAAAQTTAVALDYQANYAPALLLRGRMLLAKGRNDEAVAMLTRAETINPLPEYQWVLAEALCEAGRHDEAGLVEKRLAQHGAAADPRTYSLYLSTQGEAGQTALRLASNELNVRADVFTHDALAWALEADGNTVEAYVEMKKAVAEGTRDARLYLHATIIASQSGHTQEAEQWYSKTAGMLPQLLPSEQKLLQQYAIEKAQVDSPASGSVMAAAASTQGKLGR